MALDLRSLGVFQLGYATGSQVFGCFSVGVCKLLAAAKI